jgi:hypothetical protein
MRKIIVGAQVSMDGVMQAPDGPTEDPTKGFKFGIAKLFNDIKKYAVSRSGEVDTSCRSPGSGDDSLPATRASSGGRGMTTAPPAPQPAS